jgi:biofilm protein TabA
MITDSIENFDKYFKGEVFATIRKAISEIGCEHANGDFPLVDNSIYYKVLTYSTKNTDWITESHRKYVDIQIILSGIEKIRVFNIADVSAKDDYNTKTDCTFYNVNTHENYISEIRLREGYFTIFFPQDIHQTQIADKEIPQNVVKLVFKVNKEYFTF